MVSGKWKIFVQTLPYVFAVLAVRMVLCHVFDFPGLLEFSEVGMVITGGIFLIGFMLSGVMADYKESEKIPGELACVLEAIVATFVMTNDSKGLPNFKEATQAMRDLSQDIMAWLYRKKSQADVFKAIERIEYHSIIADKAGAGPYANRILTEATTVRKIITRMGVISRTNFLPAGYILMNSVATIVVVLLLVTKFKSPLIEGILVSFVSLIFFYMIGLIRDVEDPFEYTDGSSGGDSADVALFPLEEFIQRFDQMMAQRDLVAKNKAA